MACRCLLLPAQRLRDTCAVAFRKKLYESIESLQVDLDQWIKEYNEQRTHSGKYCFGRTPWETFETSKQLALGKMVDQTYQPVA